MRFLIMITIFFPGGQNVLSIAKRFLRAVDSTG